MRGNDFRPSRSDRISWTLAAVCMAGACDLMAMTAMIDVGAAAHDAFCAEHGWAV